MLSTKTTILAVVHVALLLTSSSARPSSRPPSSSPTPDPNTPSSDSSRTGSGGSGNSYCDTPLLTNAERQDLLAEIRGGLNGLMDILQRIHVWSASQRATVDVYGNPTHHILSENMTSSDYGRAIAQSVSYLHKFVRPVGDVLTNETVKEVNHREEGFADEYAKTRGNLTVVAKGVYKLVKGYQDIHECIIPNLSSTDNTILTPGPPLTVSNATYEDMVVDGVANELQKLTADLLEALSSFFEI